MPAGAGAGRREQRAGRTALQRLGAESPSAASRGPGAGRALPAPKQQGVRRGPLRPRQRGCSSATSSPGSCRQRATGRTEGCAGTAAGGGGGGADRPRDSRPGAAPPVPPLPRRGPSRSPAAAGTARGGGELCRCRAAAGAAAGPVVTATPQRAERRTHCAAAPRYRRRAQLDRSFRYLKRPGELSRGPPGAPLWFRGSR